MHAANPATDPSERELLRHMLATLAYRCGKTLRAAPDTFSTFSAAPSTRTPGQILAHVCDLLDWGLSIARGKQEWNNSTPQAWAADSQRFFAAVAAFDAFLEAGEPLDAPVDKLFQGPIADAFTHVGQIAILRRIAGAPMKGENYFKAEIATGRVGADQAAPRREFD